MHIRIHTYIHTLLTIAQTTEYDSLCFRLSYVCIHIYVYICAYMNIYIYICMYVYAYIHTLLTKAQNTDYDSRFFRQSYRLSICSRRRSDLKYLDLQIV